MRDCRFIFGWRWRPGRVLFWVRRAGGGEACTSRAQFLPCRDLRGCGDAGSGGCAGGFGCWAAVRVPPRNWGRTIPRSTTSSMGAEILKQYDTGVSYASPVFGPPAPTAAQVANDTTVTIGRADDPHRIPIMRFEPLPQHEPSASPLALASAQAHHPATAANMLRSAYQHWLPSSCGAAPRTSLSNYLPYLLLGLGGIAVIAVLKRR